MPDLIKLYEEDKMGMEEGKKIESQGIKEREIFLSKCPIIYARVNQGIFRDLL